MGPHHADPCRMITDGKDRDECTLPFSEKGEEETECFHVRFLVFPLSHSLYSPIHE